MKLRVLVFINAFIVALALGLVNFYFQHDSFDLILTFFITLVVCYILFYYLIERYIYSKIKLIYKLIHNLKLGKELKDALGDSVFMSDDPINDVKNEVKDWAKEKKTEIEALKQQEKFRREFLGNISHELKTPLFAVQGYIEALQDESLDDPELQRQFLAKAAKHTERLSLLIKDLDSISKLEHGDVALNYSKFDLTVLIKEVMDQMDLKARSHHIKLVFKEKYHEPTLVYADRDRICQVFINLIDNSIKYGKENGTTSIKLFELHDQILVEVTDDGVGIEEKYLNRLFERFFRTDKSRSREVGGSGLGLSIVKHILEAHQQTVTVRSTEGLGSTFAFTLAKVKTSFIPG